MDIKRENFDRNSQGNLVWAQMRYCPYWPAKVVFFLQPNILLNRNNNMFSFALAMIQIVECPPEVGRVTSTKTCVIFFGTKQL